MKSSSRNAISGLVATLLCCACDQSADLRIELQGRVYQGLKHIRLDVEISVFERRVTNAVQLLELLQTETSTTNKEFAKLRPYCDVIYVDTNYQNWLTYIERKSANAKAPSLVGEWRFQNKTNFMAIGFDDRYVPPPEAPGTGFWKVSLR
jgi:hypothetical protein